MVPTNFEIVRGVGIRPFLLGMTEVQVKSAMLQLGDVKDIRSPGGAPAWRATDRDNTFDIYVNCRDDGRAFEITAWRPQQIVDSVPVLLRGIDLFRQPAEEVFAALAAVGVVVDGVDPIYPNAFEDLVRFDRAGGDDADEDGLSPWLRSVLVVPQGYDTEYTKVVLPEFD